MRKTAIHLLALALALTTARARTPDASNNTIRDDRMGTGVHFQQGDTPNPRDYDLDKMMPLLADSGIAWLRNAIYWGQMEKTKNTYAIPAASLRWIERANAAGLKISITFNGGNKLYADHFDPDAYAKAAAYVAKTLKGKIHAMEILNEPYQKSYAGYYKGAWNGLEKDGSISSWVSRYVKLVNTAAPAIKAANPDLKVTGLGSVAPVNFRQIAMGIVPEVDGIADHPYSYRLVPELVPWAAQPTLLKRDGIATADEKGTFASQIRMYREQTRKHNGPKEIWLTEWGWATHQEARASDMNAGFTESAQAKYILRRYVESIGLGCARSFQYDFRDDGNDPHNAEHNWGLLRRDYTPKPSYHAVRRLARALDNAAPDFSKKTGLEFFPVRGRNDIHPFTWDGARLATPGSIKAYPFITHDGSTKIFLWSAERADGDTKPRLCDIEITPALPEGHTAAFYNIFEDKTETYPVETKKGRSMIKLVSIHDSPICLAIPVSVNPDK
ncbi:MAG: cellulase family glycosylhydrolase [Opitutaceae bacterium]|jgi:hypothetical protein|nr:cellulase family glycosylhydrolase [Opitutaceae bacterium]